MTAKTCSESQKKQLSVDRTWPNGPKYHNTIFCKTCTKLREHLHEYSWKKQLDRSYRMQRIAKRLFKDGVPVSKKPLPSAFHRRQGGRGLCLGTASKPGGGSASDRSEASTSGSELFEPLRQGGRGFCLETASKPGWGAAAD